MPKEASVPKVLPIMTDFILGEHSFVSTGVSRLKLTRNGEAEILPVPIQSIGVVESRAMVERTTPRAPVKMETIAKDSPAGKKLGLAEDEVRRVHDYTDKAYIEALEERGERMLWAMVLPGLAVTFRDREGQEVTDPDAIILGLKKAGISGHHLDQLSADIRELTCRAEGQADFLSGNGSGLPTP